MKLELTASAVLCAALISGCSSAPTLAVPTGEWEEFAQQYQPPPVQPAYAPLSVVPVELAQGPVTTVYAPTPVVAFTPPPGSIPVKPAAATVVLPVSEKSVPQTPVNKPATPALAGSSFGVVSASPGPVPPMPAGQPVPDSAKPASSVLAKAEPTPGSIPAPVTASLASAKPATTVPPSPPVPAVPATKPLKAFKVSPEGKTIRETLAQWAKDEGWTFNPIGGDYWTVPHDFDVVATETFYDDFIGATRKLIASTELTSTPLQPCFFKNKAVRVIRTNEECAAQASQGRKP